MTVQNIPVINKWTGNGTNKIFDFDFRIDNASQLRVSLSSDYDTPLVLGTDYRIIDIDNGSNYPLESGQIEYPLSTSEHEVLTNEETIILELSIPFIQAVPFSQGGITASAIEECLDYNVRLMQRLKQDNDGFKDDIETSFEQFQTTIDSEISTIQTSVNTANTNASNAVIAANSANTKADNAVSTANTANTNASNAVTTANNANSVANTASINATNAVNTANSASSTATAASNKVDEFAENIETVIEAAEDIEQFHEAINTCNQKATQATTAATNASTSATTASQKVTEITNLITDFNNQKGQANGIAPLDANAKLPIIHIPTGVELTANKNVANGYCGLDGLGKIPQANIPDLFIKKSGDTMTGTLEFDKSMTTGASTVPCVRLNMNHTVNVDNPPVSNIYLNNELIYDNEDKVIYNERLRLDTDNKLSRYFTVENYDAQGEKHYAEVGLHCYADGSAGFGFPKCETKPTTVSSAYSNRVAVVTQNYVNDTSWYRVWSDGFIEQGGQIAVSSSSVTVNLLKSYSDAKYALTTGNYQSAVGSGNCSITSISKNKFVLDCSGLAGLTVLWQAAGY